MILLARRMGFSTILLAGFDFAHRGVQDHHRGAGFDDLLHAGATRYDPFPSKLMKRMQNDRPVLSRDAHGGPLFSTYKLMLYRSWLERELEHGDLFRLNNGAMIPGIPLVGKEEMLERWGPEIRGEFQERWRSAATVDFGDGVRAEGARVLHELLERETEPADMSFLRRQAEKLNTRRAET
jgi:hypothetical protein